MKVIEGSGLLCALLAGACTNVNTSGSTDTLCSEISAQPLVPAPGWQGTVFTVVMENHGLGDILGNPDAPYINALIRDNALAAGYRDNFVHPSEPNYIWMVAGQNFGILDDAAPASHHLASRSHLVDQLEMQGLSWKGYMDSMGEPCRVTSAYPYEPKHDPFVYFDDINGWDGTQFDTSSRCAEHVVDYTQLARDLAAGTVPKYAFITPDMQHDMHDGSIAAGDAWLAAELPAIFASPAYQNGGVLFLTWDEGSDQEDDPPMIVVSPHARHGYVSNAAYNASSYLKTVQVMLGVEPLPCDPDHQASVVAMDDLFDVPFAAVDVGAPPP